MTGLFRCLSGLLTLTLLSGCGESPVQQIRPPDPLPAEVTTGATVYRIQPGASAIRLFIYRGGTMASLGHNHVVNIAEMNGAVYLQDDFNSSGMQMIIPVRKMQLDKKEHRREAGMEFSSHLSKADIQATRENMLGKDLLDAAHYPTIYIRSVDIYGSPPEIYLKLRFTVRGLQRELSIPAEISIDNRQLIVWGETEINQTALGLTPYSVMLGALTVQDRLEVRFHIVAHSAAVN